MIHDIVEAEKLVQRWEEDNRLKWIALNPQLLSADSGIPRTRGVTYWRRLLLVLGLARRKTRHVSELGPPPKLVVRKELTREKSYGWVFTMGIDQSDETCTREGGRLIGLGPIVVWRTTGQIYHLGTYGPIDQVLQDFERDMKVGPS